jgi:hypothetical protein
MTKNLEAFAFENKYGWMNAMTGSKWKTLLKTYNTEYKKQLQLLSGEFLAEKFKEELNSQPSYTHPSSLDDVSYEMHGAQTIVWTMKNKQDHHVATDIDVDGDRVWAIEDNSNGAEQYTLQHYINGKQHWSTTKPLGPYVAVVGARCYAIETENFLWMNRVVSFDAKTGKDRQVELELEDPKWNLQLIKGTYGCLFAAANNAGIQRCWVLQTGNFEELEGYESFLAIGYCSKESKEVCFFGRKGGTDIYKPVNCHGKFPSFQTQTPEWFDPSVKLVGTRQFGKRTVWSTETGKPVLSLVGNIDVDTIQSWKGHLPSITIQEPGSYRQTYADYIAKEKLCAYAKSQYKFTKSKDKTSVPYILVSNCKPKHLLCIVYGAYGVPTRMNTDRWKPLLDRGWGLCFALVRGGGDNTDRWAESGRRGNKIHSIEDFEACIRAAQQKFSLKPSDTVVYGRSAGGYTVGACLSRNASGKLFRAVYTEVPYVDVFQTTSNPNLPLTQLEYDEFGNPRRLENAQALLSLSPIDTLPPTGAPTVFVLSRTALNDKEVLAYESVKWITALEESQKGVKNAAPKLVAIEMNEGHFAPHTTMLTQRAEDMALFSSWLLASKKSHVRIYQMANTRRNRRSTRKNNVTARKNNVTMGGKRRRSATRKGKGRKGSRKH